MSNRCSTWVVGFLVVFALMLTSSEALAQRGGPITSEAQARRNARMPPQFLGASIGYGLSFPDEEGHSIDGEGFYAEAEYILGLSSWFTPRGYAGMLLTFSEKNDYCTAQGVHCEVSAKIGFLGVKGRLTIPIPYLAPFIEVGVGASIGVMKTRTLAIDEDMAGATYHIPFAIGLSLGKDNDVDIAFAYLFHPSERRDEGAIAIGLTFKLAD